MKNIQNLLLALLALLILNACAGRDFSRPSSSEITVGKSTKSEILRKMGDPRSSNELIKNGEKVQILSYVYARGSAPGVISPARAMVFSIHSDILVGTAFISSFDEDSTFFESDKISDIKKGISTKTDIIRIFGKPSGEVMYPITKSKDERGITYSYVQVRNIGVGNIKDNKQLVVIFDSNDVITDYTYTGSGI